MKETKKTAFCLLVFCLGGIALIAQPRQGSWLLGGGFSVVSSNAEDGINQNSSSTSFVNIQPNVGVMVSEEIAVGMGLGYEYEKRELTFSGFQGENVDKTNLYILRPFFRYYKALLADRIGFYLEGAGRIGVGDFSQKNNGGFVGLAETEGDVLQLGGDLIPGAFILVTERLSIEATFGSFNYRYTERQTNEDQNNFKEIRSFLEARFSSSFGLQFTLFFG